MDAASDETTHPSGANHVVQSAPYILRRPSPPFIRVPAAAPIKDHGLSLMPSYEYVDSTQLNSRDLGIITQNHRQVATEHDGGWSYEKRRSAQAILDFLHLGPNSVARDHAYLQRERITMILVARDARMATRRLLSVDKTAESLGIVARYVDVEGPAQLISGFPETIRLINDHMLAIYHGQARGKDQHGHLLVEADSFRRGKVLVTCETGNDRSGAIVAAYIMSVFGQNMISTLQFISVQRFCCTFDEDCKRILQSWEDILRARSAVAMDAQTQPGGAKSSKRGIDDTIDHAEGSTSTPEPYDLDRERFAGRDAFAPFTDMN